MSPTTLSVHFYATDAGTEPVQYGWPLGMPLVRKMEQHLWEVRVPLAGRIARVLFTLEGDSMVLLHGFIKKSQKTPSADISIAKQRMK